MEKERKKYVLRLDATIVNYIQQQAKERGMTETNVIRGILADRKQQDERAGGLHEET